MDCHTSANRKLSSATNPSALAVLLEAQQRAHLAQGLATAAQRLDRIDRTIELLLGNADAFVETLSKDFGHRSPVQSLATDIFGILPPLKHTRAHVREWMKPQYHSAGPLGWIGGRARIEWVPRGVVGIISPWNFPVAIALQPLAQAFAAGNRAMIKVSEFAPRTGELLQRLVEQSFDPTEAVVVTGGVDVGAEFSRLPFDLIFFTGATGIARHIQRACADNLVPCVLELGGKSPVVIAPDANLDKVAERVAFAKTLNAGQICLSPDYVFVPEGKEQAFVEAMRRAITALYPSLRDNEDYTSIITDHHYRRLSNYLEDARAKGAEVLEINPAQEDFSAQPHHKLPPTLILKPTADMLVLQEEIFGPVLPVMGYRHIDEVIDWVNARPSPLATYYFGQENAMCRRFLDRTISGGVTINDVLLHVMNDDLPFGGVGDSGMGYYHGRAGFETFSHPRSILSAPTVFSTNRLLAPPYGTRIRRVLAWLKRRELKAVRSRLRRA